MEVFNLDGDIYVTIGFLSKYGLNERSIHNALVKNRSGKSRHYEHIVDAIDHRMRLIKYRTLPKQTIRKYSLPSRHELYEVSDKAVETERLKNLISQHLGYAYERGYLKYQHNYFGIFLDGDLIRSYARTHAIFHAIATLYDFNIQLKDLFKQYCELQFLQFETSSLKSFYRKFKEFKAKGQLAFLHRNLGLTKSGRKITENHKKEIIRLYSLPDQLAGREIHKQINFWAIRNGHDQISLSSLKKIIADPIIQNQSKPSRNGKEWMKRHFDPFFIRKHPEKNGELWELDGSRFQFPYATDKGVGFLWFFVVMDIHSRRIVGYSCGKSETHGLVIEAIAQAVLNTGYLPYEMIIDNGSCFNHEKFKLLEENMSFIAGTYVRRHLPKHAQDKAHVERFFSTFQTTVCKGKFGYVGEGIRSKREEGRPSREKLDEFMKSKNLRSEVEIRQLLDELIIEYNALKIHEDRHAPDIAFKIAKFHSDIRYVSENQYALLFSDSIKEYQVRNSCILLSEGNRSAQFQYIIYDPDLRIRLNGTKVHIRYNRLDRSKIKLFDCNEIFIVELELHIPLEVVRTRTKTSKVEFSDTLIDDAHDMFSDNEKSLFYEPATLEVMLNKIKQ